MSDKLKRIAQLIHSKVKKTKDGKRYIEVKKKKIQVDNLSERELILLIVKLFLDRRSKRNKGKPKEKVKKWSEDPNLLYLKLMENKKNNEEDKKNRENRNADKKTEPTPVPKPPSRPLPALPAPVMPPLLEGDIMYTQEQLKRIQDEMIKMKASSPEAFRALEREFKRGLKALEEAKRKADEENKKANEAVMKAEKERQKADEERRIREEKAKEAEEHRQKAEKERREKEYQQKLKQDAEERARIEGERAQQEAENAKKAKDESQKKMELTFWDNYDKRIKDFFVQSETKAGKKVNTKFGELLERYKKKKDVTGNMLDIVRRAYMLNESDDESKALRKYIVDADKKTRAELLKGKTYDDVSYLIDSSNLSPLLTKANEKPIEQLQPPAQPPKPLKADEIVPMLQQLATNPKVDSLIEEKQAQKVTEAQPLQLSIPQVPVTPIKPIVDKTKTLRFYVPTGDVEADAQLQKRDEQIRKNLYEESANLEDDEGIDSNDILIEMADKLKQTVSPKKGKGIASEEGLYSDQIEKVMGKYESFAGVFANDQYSDLANKVKPQSRGSAIVNTDNSNNKGKHWQAIYWDARPNGSKSIEFFDSFGDEPTSHQLKGIKLIVDKLKPDTYLKMKVNKVKQQSANSSNCGYFCMKFLIDRYRGKSFSDSTGYTQHIQSNVKEGEKSIEKFKRQIGGCDCEFKYI